jgi:2-methylcitrate dehydratase PrpD
VSAQHAVAVALASGKAGLAEFSDAAVADPRLRTFGERVRFVDDPSQSVESAQVTLLLRGGERRTHRVAAARGSLAAPLADVELSAKLRDLASYAGADRDVDVERLLALLWRLDREPDAAMAMRLARRHPSNPDLTREQPAAAQNPSKEKK